MTRALIFAALLLAGCSSPVPVRDEIVAHIRLVDQINYKPGYDALGLSRCANGVCVVEIRRDTYPACVIHEIRHVFEGDWHAGRETIEDC